MQSSGDFEHIQANNDGKCRSFLELLPFVYLDIENL